MDRIRLGLIGCGGFARGMHIPNIEKNPKFTIQAAMDMDGASAKKVAEDTGADYWTDSLERILEDSEVNAVLITTRHDSHASLTVRSAEAGKHVLCEKPMGLNVEEVQSVFSAVSENGIKYTVGYNRGLSPLITRAKELLRNLDGKIMVYHRLQAPFPEESWTHDPAVGGGRFIGEGCHIFDLICELMKAPPVSVYAAGGTFLDPQKVIIPDSAVVTLTFADGSVGTTLISSVGCSSFDKEATEIYCANKAIYIQNFQRMEWHGFAGQEEICMELDEVDKGHTVELDLFADAIRNNTESPNGLIQAARAAVISFKVVESLRSGVPVAIAEQDYNFSLEDRT